MKLLIIAICVLVMTMAIEPEDPGSGFTVTYDGKDTDEMKKEYDVIINTNNIAKTSNYN